MPSLHLVDYVIDIHDKEHIGAIVEVFFYCVFAFVASCIALVLYWLFHIFSSLFSYFLFE